MMGLAASHAGRFNVLTHSASTRAKAFLGSPGSRTSCCMMQAAHGCAALPVQERRSYSIAGRKSPLLVPIFEILHYVPTFKQPMSRSNVKLKCKSSTTNSSPVQPSIFPRLYFLCSCFKGNPETQTHTRDKR